MITLKLKTPNLVEWLRGDWAFIAVQHNDARLARNARIARHKLQVFGGNRIVDTILT